MKKQTRKYYKKFSYRIEKKITVQECKDMKNYAKKGLYVYVIHDNIDNNRFFFISNSHYEEQQIINSSSFIFARISSNKDSLYLKKNVTEFNKIYFTKSEKKADVDLMLSDFAYKRTKDGKVFYIYKTHTKKIAIDNPQYYKDLINSYGIKNYKKKFEREVLYCSSYNEEIWNNFISSLFVLKSVDFQRFNDHAFIFDGGKTGKSSLISYVSSKADNVSLAGLYGSSDSKNGRFRGGLITLTDNNIIIDETNEMIQNKKNSGDRVLSILNTILENGEYNYIKQFSATITSSNQFMFMGNIDDEFNLSIFLEGLFGNVTTLGRRIGIITYNTNLKGFEKGKNRPKKPSTYVLAIKDYLTDIFNYIFSSTKFYNKLIVHSDYKKLETEYKTRLRAMLKDTDNLNTYNFIKSHCESIDRLVTRALKLYLFENLNKFLRDDKPFYDNHLIYKVLLETKKVIEQNIHNIEHIIEHMKKAKITSRADKINSTNFSFLKKFHKKTLEIFYKNIEKITQKGTIFQELENNESVKVHISRIRNKKTTTRNINNVLNRYGCRINLIQNEVFFAFDSKNKFIRMTKGLFDNEEKKEENKNIDNIGDDSYI